ncbi:helix-turn-helix domain-containing protein [Oceanithermus desulfurans]|uniref:Transcriptional regulator SdrP n=2 Tax=Oceanithermus desulfurans TaxID=227924 RepID=A0A511RJ80_9DEIN|nr:helix-turn-helix domain-containing protein [Oceanithermus desulfurans]MBB6029602.1 CRP-like cAMP-binding protein [Oceanithermus desulfurans]GEM89703.1 transcriptional regulator SdrP [Oceanithermus desulfurans NBRC 100063]
MTQGSIIDTLAFRAGEIILYPGSPGPRDRIYRVESGLVRIQSVDDDGNALTLRFVRPGEYFGEEALSGGERRYHAEAAADTRIAQIHPERMDPQETLNLAVRLALALGQTYDAIQRLVSQRLKNRIAAALLEFMDTPLAVHDNKGRVMIHVTHDEIASAVGSVRETVTKVVGELVREGLIKSGYGRVMLLDIEALGELARQNG